MDKSKKSFLFNIEWCEVLMDYPPEVRLEVYDAIFRYVASGTLSELKPVAKMAFSFIKKEIDYNENKYQQVTESRREAGRKGAATTNGKKRQTSANPANADFDEQKRQTSAKLGIYDNDNDIKKKSEKRNPDGAEVLEAYFDKSRRGSLESLAMSLHVGMDELRAIAEECVNDWTLGGETHTDMSEAQKHLTNHIRRKAEAWRQNPVKKTATPAIPRERWAARIERRSETEWVVHQYGDVEPIPVGTPDPPGPTHVWYNGQWVHQ